MDENYIAIAEPSEDGKTWWISFPGLPGISSAANGPGQIVAHAQNALASAIEAGTALPTAIEDGVVTPYDLTEFQKNTAGAAGAVRRACAARYRLMRQTKRQLRGMVLNPAR